MFQNLGSSEEHRAADGASWSPPGGGGSGKGCRGTAGPGGRAFPSRRSSRLPCLPRIRDDAGSAALVRSHPHRGATRAKREPGAWDRTVLPAPLVEGLVQEPPSQVATPEARVSVCRAPARSQEAPQGELLMALGAFGAWPYSLWSWRRKWTDLPEKKPSEDPRILPPAPLTASRSCCSVAGERVECVPAPPAW